VFEYHLAHLTSCSLKLDETVTMQEAHAPWSLLDVFLFMLLTIDMLILQAYVPAVC